MVFVGINVPFKNMLNLHILCHSIFTKEKGCNGSLTQCQIKHPSQKSSDVVMVWHTPAFHPLAWLLQRLVTRERAGQLFPTLSCCTHLNSHLFTTLPVYLSPYFSQIQDSSVCPIETDARRINVHFLYFISFHNFYMIYNECGSLGKHSYVSHLWVDSFKLSLKF